MKRSKKKLKDILDKILRDSSFSDEKAKFEKPQNPNDIKNDLAIYPGGRT